MKKPIILIVDDDPEVLQSLAQDMRQQYGKLFRIVRANSGAEALDAARQVKLANDEVALMLSDQRMPGMNGVEFLNQARPLFPNAKRALLTAYADTEVAIHAINDVQLDYYLMKPWDPPGEKLFPVLDDLVDDWKAHYRPPFEGIRIVGHRWSQESHDIRDFLAGNQIPFSWLDLAAESGADEILELAAMSTNDVPVLVFPDGSVMSRPSMAAIAEKIGLSHQIDLPLYDLVIVGGGPAGLAAAVYGASEGLNTAVVERHAPGGQAGTSSRIENYLGFPAGLSGDDLARRAITQAKRFGADFMLTHEVSGLSAAEGSFGVKLSEGAEIRATNLIIATGVKYRMLDVPGADQLNGRGIFYGAATTEAASVKDKEVFVVGGANSAGQAAIYLSKFAKSVTMLVRGPSLSSTMSHYLVERIQKSENIHCSFRTSVTSVEGETQLETINVVEGEAGVPRSLPADAMFVFIGAAPSTAWLDGSIETDERGFVLTGPDVHKNRADCWKLDRDPFLLETSLPGAFAAGDVRSGSGKRVATAVGEGAMAVMSVWQHRALSGL